MILQNTFICSISNVTIKNINTNTTNPLQGFDGFEKYEFTGIPHYLLPLHLEARYTYEIGMTITNNKGSIEKICHIRKLQKNYEYGYFLLA